MKFLVILVLIPVASFASTLKVVFSDNTTSKVETITNVSYQNSIQGLKGTEYLHIETESGKQCSILRNPTNDISPRLGTMDLLELASIITDKNIAVSCTRDNKTSLTARAIGFNFITEE